MREMKDSGIVWIGKIPSEWKVGLVGRYFDEVKNPNSNQVETNTLQFKMGDIISKKGGDSKYNPESIEAYNIVEPGTIMINGLNLSFDLISQRVAQVHEKGAITSTYLALSPINGMQSDYAKFLLKAYDNNKALHAMGRGLRATLSYGTFRTESILIPSVNEQIRISEILDTKCSEIDTLISLQEEMISELQAYKQSVITEAVTKGLTPNVPIKDSGVEWIGKIPEGWKVCALRYLFFIMDYLREPISAEQRSRNNPVYDYYGASGVIDKIDYYNVDDTVLLIGEDGANLKMRNLPLIYKASGKFWVNNHAHILKPIDSDYDFMAYILEAADYNNYITGSAQPKLSQEKLKAVLLCVPPLSEQQTIASYLDEKTSQIDSLIAIKREKIEELKDYKKSIIYEYVTGKKRVI